MPPFVPSQLEEGESQQVSNPPLQEEPTSPSASMKQKRIKIQIKKSKRITKRMMPFPSILETILEGDEEEEDEEEEEE